MAKAKSTKLDDLFSEYIRKRAMKTVGGCERCLTSKHDKQKEDGSIFPAWKQLQCSHFWGRGRHSVRYDEDNCAGLCGACHMFFTAQPPEHTEWFKRRLGEDGYNMLMGRMRQTWPKPDKKLIEIYLKEKLKEVNDEP